jgi:hypothetical protein
MEGKTAMSDSASAVVVPCGNHPDQRATHNCMNCGKPLCMTCVAARGYYCSDECKAAVQAAVPSAPRDPNLDRLDAQMDRGLSTVATVFRKWIKPVLVVLVLVAGYGAYRLFFGPAGAVTATATVTSSVGLFHAKPVGTDAVLVRANDELYRLRLRTQTKDWSLNLPDAERWNLAGVRGDEVHLRSSNTLRRLDAQTGVVISETPLPRRAGILWSAFNPWRPRKRSRMRNQSRTSRPVIPKCFPPGACSVWPEAKHRLQPRPSTPCDSMAQPPPRRKWRSRSFPARTCGVTGWLSSVDAIWRCSRASARRVGRRN